MAKLTSNLRRRLAATPAGHPIEVVVEIGTKAGPSKAPLAGGRTEKMTALKRTFSASAEPIERAIEQSGGEVLARTWLNQSLMVRVPREAVKALEERDDIERLDMPTPLTPD